MSPAQAEKKKDPNADKIAEMLVEVQPLTGSAYKFVGQCKQCGWQTMQNDEGEAKDLVKQHAEKHAVEIQAKMNAGSGAQPERKQEPSSRRV